MYPWLIVAFSLASFAIISVLNTVAWNKLEDSRENVRAATLLIEHSCRHNRPDRPANLCDRDDTRYAHQSVADLNCTYTKTGYEIRSRYLSVLADKTKHSYYCVWQKKGGALVQIPGVANAKGCESGPPVSLDLVPGAVVVCQKG